MGELFKLPTIEERSTAALWRRTALAASARADIAEYRLGCEVRRRVEVEAELDFCRGVIACLERHRPAPRVGLVRRLLKRVGLA